MSKNTIRAVENTDFKKIIETALGHSTKQDNVAVVRFNGEHLSEHISAIDFKDFIFKMTTFNRKNYITSKDVAVITPKNLSDQETSTYNEKDNIEKIGSRLNLRNKP